MKSFICGIIIGAIGTSLLLPLIGWRGVIGLYLLSLGDTLITKHCK